MRRFEKKPQDPAEVRLASALAPEARTLRRAAWMSVLSALVWIAMAACVATVFHRLVAGPINLPSLWGFAALFAGFGLLRVGLGYWSAALLDAAADRVLERERAALLALQDRLSPRAERATSASVGALLTDKLALLEPYILRYRPAFLKVAVIPVVFFLVALPLSWAVALILLVAGPLIPVFMALVGMAAREASERQMDEIGSLSTLLGERLAALTDIRLLDAQDRTVEEFSDRAEGLRVRTMAVLRVAFLSSTVLELFSAIGVAMVAVYVGFALLGELGFGAGATPLTLGQGIFLLMLAPEFFQPLRDLAAAWHDKASALAVSRDLLEVEGQDAEDILGSGEASHHITTPASGALITSSGLGLGALEFPDLHVSEGEAVALTGPSGSGKSTLIALVGGLLRPDRGTLCVEGQPLTAETADAWRSRIAWVPQTAQFLAGPLRESLLLGAADQPSEKQIHDALELASAHWIVDRLAQGLDTPLGEAGGGVSGGEARRLLLARAALSARPILLADEPTADLDPETGAEIIKALLALKSRGVTLIVATHDRALVSALDREIAIGTPYLEATA